MRSSLKQILVFYAFIFISESSFSQCFQSNYDSAYSTHVRGEYEKSVWWAKQALICAEKELSSNNDTNYINILNLLAISYYGFREIDSALRYFEIEAEIRKNISGDTSFIYGSSLTNLGIIYNYSYKYEKSEKCLLTAEKIFRNTGHDTIPDFGELLLGISLLYSNTRKYDLAEKYYRFASEIISKFYLPPHERWVICQNGIATMLIKQGKLNLAEKQFLLILKSLADAGIKNGELYSRNLLNLGPLYYQMGKNQLALEHILKGINLLDKNNRFYNRELSYAYNFLSQIYLSSGDYKLAEKYAKQSLEIRKNIFGEKHPDYINSSIALANFFYVTGNFKSAKEWYNNSLEKQYAITGEKDYNYTSMLNNFGIILHEIGSTEEARIILEKTVELRKIVVGENHFDFFGSLINLAGVYSEQGDFQRAEKCYWEGITGLETTLGKKHPHYGTSLLRTAQLFFNQKKFDDAEKLNDSALSVLSNLYSEFNPKVIEAMKLKALISQLKGDFDLAEKFWNMTLLGCLAQVDKNFSGLSDKEKSDFWKQIQKNFEEYNTFIYLRSGADVTRINTNPAIIGELYDFRLKTKALLLNNSGKIKNRILNSSDSALITIYKKWQHQKEYTAYLYTKSKEDLDKDGINLDSLEKNSDLMEKKISLKSEEFSIQKESKKISWIDIRSNLKNDEAAIEIIRFRKYSMVPLHGNPTVMVPSLTDTVHYGIMVVTKKTKNHPEIVFLENGNELEKEFYTNYLRTIKNKLDDKISFNYFWKPILPKLTGIRRIYVSPDGVFNLINLSCLKNPETQNYVLDEFEIHYLTSTRSLVQEVSIKEKKNQKRKIAGVGDAFFNSSLLQKECTSDFTPDNVLQLLPGTRKEINELNKFSISTRYEVITLTGDTATEENVKSLSNPWVLHLATHGFFLSENQITGQRIFGIDSIYYQLNPLLKSGLFLAGCDILPYVPDSCKSTSENGILTAYEVMNLNLDSTKLVVLSACETGLGDVQNGEGVHGLYRAFRMAGAEKIIMSLWKINDFATLELMNTFYSLWKFKGDPVKPFREAQLEMKERFKNPYFWGAFILVE